jgi:hypothetical protein
MAVRQSEGTHYCCRRHRWLREQLDDENMGPILKEMLARRQLEQKDNADCSLIYKSQWVQWNLLVVRWHDGVQLGVD